MKRTIKTEVGTNDIRHLLALGYEIEVNRKRRAYIFKDGQLEYVYCADCGEVIHINEFTRNRSRKHGLYTYCLGCHAVRSEKTRQAERTDGR